MDAMRIVIENVDPEPQARGISFREEEDLETEARPDEWQVDTEAEGKGMGTGRLYSSRTSQYERYNYGLVQYQKDVLPPDRRLRNSMFRNRAFDFDQTEAILTFFPPAWLCARRYEIHIRRACGGVGPQFARIQSGTVGVSNTPTLCRWQLVGDTASFPDWSSFSVRY